MVKKRPLRGGGKRATPRGSSRSGRAKPPVVPLDAEDIAMARLQAHLRKTEAIRAPRRPRTRPGQRAVRLPREMLEQVRSRARREGATISEVVEAALRRYLRSP